MQIVTNKEQLFQDLEKHFSAEEINLMDTAIDSMVRFGMYPSFLIMGKEPARTYNLLKKAVEVGCLKYDKYSTEGNETWIINGSYQTQAA